MRQTFIASVAFLTLMAGPVMARDHTAATDELPVYREGQVISTEAPAEPARPVQGKAAMSARDTLLNLPDFSTLGKAAQSGNSAAWQAYAQTDYVQARLLAAHAGAEGDAKAQLLMGLMLDHALGGEADPVNAVKWFKKSAGQGVTESWLALAGMAFDNRGGLSAGDARGFLHQAAQQGDMDAMMALGKAYASGMGGPIDDAQARKWYQNAISQGSNKARVALADLTLAADDEEAAFKLYRTAMFGGSAEAAWKAGVLLADPASKLHDRAKAGEYLQTAATAGLPRAMTDTGTWYATAKPPLYAQAARWFRKAAQADEPQGQYLYAVALAKGQGVMQDRELAYEWVLRAHAHDQGNTAYEDLELALEKGMPPKECDLIFSRAQMPLLITHTSVAEADRAAEAEAKQKQQEAKQAKQAETAKKAGSVAGTMEEEPTQSGAPE